MADNSNPNDGSTYTDWTPGMSDVPRHNPAVLNPSPVNTPTGAQKPEDGYQVPVGR